MNRRGMFCDAANEKRSRNILRVELRRIDPDCLEIDILKEMMQTVSSSDIDIAELREMFTSSRRSRMSTSIATEEKKDDTTEKDDEKEERERRNELKRMKMEKDQKEREVDMIPYQVRLRALGRAGASRSLRFKRLRKPRLLGQFVTQEDKNVSKRSSTPAPGSGKMFESVMSQNSDFKNDEKILDETKRHDVSSSSSSRKHPKHSSRSKLGEHERRKADIDRIERVWNDLEYPVQERMSFLCKYSQAEDAINLRPVVDASVRLCELILMRETVLSDAFSSGKSQETYEWEHVSQRGI